MPLANKQRDARIKERGEPLFSLEFDIFDGDELSMWAHLDHGSDFEKTKEYFKMIRDHIDQFIRDEGMCPFHIARAAGKDKEEIEDETKN